MSARRGQRRVPMRAFAMRNRCKGTVRSEAAMLVIACGLVACDRTPAAPSAGTTPGAAPVSQQAPARFPRPVTMQLNQRSRTGLPESDPAIFIQLGDITNGQVEVTIVNAAKGVIAGPKSLRRDHVLDFELGDELLTLRVGELKNALLGQDVATIVVAPRVALGATDGATGIASSDGSAEIEALLTDLAGTKGAVFIRNGTEYSAEDAAAHLRSKWLSTRSRIRSAEDFIRNCGTRSSVSHEPYLVRLEDGRTISSAEFLRARLGMLAPPPIGGAP